MGFGKHEVQYPIGTVALYGPDDQTATKIVVGIILTEGGEAAHIRRWYSDGSDIREDETVQTEVTAFLKEHNVRAVGAPEQILGCPHEEGIDYPEGSKCPACPFWANRDRWTGTIYN